VNVLLTSHEFQTTQLLPLSPDVAASAQKGSGENKSEDATATATGETTDADSAAMEQGFCQKKEILNTLHNKSHQKLTVEKLVIKDEPREEGSTQPESAAAQQLVAPDVELIQLENCHVVIDFPNNAADSSSAAKTSNTPPRQLGALHIRNLKNCVIEVFPTISSSCLLHDCVDCVFVFHQLQQLRIHTSKNLVFYVNIASGPIIEHCEDVFFASISNKSGSSNVESSNRKSASPAQKNLWNRVQDFRWLRREASPNWCTVEDVVDYAEVSNWKEENREEKSDTSSDSPGGTGSNPISSNCSMLDFECLNSRSTTNHGALSNFPLLRLTHRLAAAHEKLRKSATAEERKRMAEMKSRREAAAAKGDAKSSGGEKDGKNNNLKVVQDVSGGGDDDDSDDEI
jgi:hypothetical protein